MPLTERRENPGTLELQYFSRALGSSNFVVRARAAFEVTTDPSRCALLQHSLRARQFEFCTGQDISVNFKVPAATTDLELRLVSILSDLSVFLQGRVGS
eukprot:2812211-Rhodomonas_salina.1